MAVIQPNDNRHCQRPNSVSQHSLLDRDESQNFYPLDSPFLCDSFPSYFRYRYKRTATVTLLLTSLSHIKHWTVVQNACIQTVTLDMHRQQRFVEWSIAKTLACNFSTMWAQIKKKNCHSQSALRQRRKREGFAFRAQILIKDLFLSAFPVSWPSLSSLGWGWSKQAWQIPLNSAQVFA